jgi:F-type H+-transporting ATPase subunit delta
MSTVSLRYAHAFGDVVKANHIDAVVAKQQLEDFSGTLLGSPELHEFLGNPSIPAPEKLKIVDAVTARIGVYPQVRNFIAVIMTHERLHALPEIVAEFAAFADQAASITDAVVTTARPLHDADRIELEARIGALAGGAVRTTYTQDSTLLGGAVVRIGSTVYDGSVRAQLQQLKEKLIDA